MTASNVIRPAKETDAERLAEIEIFNYRLNFYPIFRADTYYFDDLRVSRLAAAYRKEPRLLAGTHVYDDGVVKGFLRVRDAEIEKLFVEPMFQRAGIGTALLTDALNGALASKPETLLWALEKNTSAIRFYARHGFHPTGERKRVADTDEFLVRLIRFQCD